MASTGPEPYVVQVWIVPAAPLEKPVTIPGVPAVSMRNVQIDFPPTYRGSATLLETDGTQQGMHQDPVPDMARIGKVIFRLSFSLLSGFNVLAARIVPKGLKEGERTDEIYFPGAPPGISFLEQKVGLRQHREFGLDFLRGDLEPEVEGAITWFLAGLFAPNSIYQVLNHWIGLEMLAPTIEGPWRCGRCGVEMEVCPNCGHKTEEPRATRSIREFLMRRLGVSSREFEELSELRNAISHGRLPMDQAGIREASNKSFRIQELLLQGIKHSLGWLPDKPPLIEPEGIVIGGVPAVGFTNVTVRSDFYEKFHE